MKLGLHYVLCVCIILSTASCYRYYTPKLNGYSVFIDKIDCRFADIYDPMCFCESNKEFVFTSPLYVTYYDPSFMLYYHNSDLNYTATDINSKIFAHAKKYHMENIFKNLKEIRTTPKNMKPKIPLSYHHLWITNQSNPSSLIESYFIYLDSSTKMRFEDSNWNFYIWTNVDEEKFVNLKRLKKYYPNLKVMNTNLINLKPKTSELVQKLYEERRYSEIAAIYKVYILSAVGGVYLDFDTELVYPLEILMYGFPDIFITENNIVKGYFLATAPQNKIYEWVINQIESMDEFFNQIPIVGDLHQNIKERINILLTSKILHEIASNPNYKGILIPQGIAQFIYHERELSDIYGYYDQAEAVYLEYCLNNISGQARVKVFI